MESENERAIERRLADLEHEVARLFALAEGRIDVVPSDAPDPSGAPGSSDVPGSSELADVPDVQGAGAVPDAADTPAGADDPLWFVNELGRRVPGAVMMAGAVDTAAGPVRWQYGLMADALLSQDWSDLARPLEALGHPARIELVRQVLRGAHTTAELLQLEHLASSGQLYHHLRQLVAAGWLVSPRRGYYEVPAARVVPLLVLTMIASS
ncbi:winged helix-turn-helix transcriptional regulator [Microbacterium sp. ANT_H45B]|uniref:ArsR/SmtB family transcription factor n=2 Tax=unclassified Microbacterium TaxID=2609290 RepID=UPI0011EFAD21|nr:winged helix-turn-helix domain-containing protein [Microbacterium sp. ANT_H45B]KAA0961891.1 winged helix-turn-helix transcriptional regulator [Microbacterium sp. ANT_H45B]